MKRFAAAMLIVLVAGAAGIVLLVGVRSPERPPNVVFILIDAVRADRLGAERDGHPVMPFLTQMAAEGVQFTDAITPCTWTRPAMASVFTGVSVDAHQVYFSNRRVELDRALSDVLAQGFETMAEWLRAQGYATFAVQTNANLTAALGFAQGYDLADYRFRNGGIAQWVTDTALGGAWAADTPFFLYAHYMDPHAPYEPPPGFDPPWDMPALSEPERGLLDSEHFMDFYLDQVRVALGLRENSEYPPLSETGREWVRARYDAEIHYMDMHIARLVQGIRDVFPDTLFVVAADHGEEFWERDGLGHGTTLHAEQLRVPFFITGPGIDPAVRDDPATLLDLLPTLAQYLGVAPLPDWEGRALLERATDTGPARFARTKAPWPELEVNLEAVVDGAHTLIRDLDRGSVRLYDRETDPDERNDIAAERPGRVQELLALLDAHRAACAAYAEAGPAGEAMELTGEAMEALEALGYLDGEPPETTPPPPPAETQDEDEDEGEHEADDEDEEEDEEDEA